MFFSLVNLSRLSVEDDVCLIMESMLPKSLNHGSYTQPTVSYGTHLTDSQCMACSVETP